MERAVNGLEGGNMTMRALPDGCSRIQGRCVQTGELWSVKVKTDKLMTYLRLLTNPAIRTPLIQEAFPDMEPEAREYLVSGISPDGWDQMFGKTNG